ncbi:MULTISPECIES: C40 family peptidase [Alcaligenes]|jgi:cell wall-associated NlpC family hydrolase|uniref:C40 family peptidase n=1 Tax=Alcaligenes TaxID=507 RepID=UPI0026B81F63
MPPHYLNPPALLHITYRSAKYLLLAGALALTGCATTGTQQSSQNKDRAELDHAYYADYEFQTESDPLGTYLANRARNDINIAYSSDRRQGRTESRSSRNASSNHGLATTALNFLGVKYSFGGDAPSTGFDCSGLVSYVAEKSLGLKLPRQSKDIAKEGISVNRSELRKGDLVFFNTRGARFSHVGIYLGDDKFVHAPRTGAVVRVESMQVGYWKKRYNGARRLAAADTQQSEARLRSVK